MQEFGLTGKALATSTDLLDEVFNDIDEDKDGEFSREEMFEHLKKAREKEFERKEESPVMSPKLPSLPSGMNKIMSEQNRLSLSMNTPLALPGSPSPNTPGSPQPRRNTERNSRLNIQ